MADRLVRDDRVSTPRRRAASAASDGNRHRDRDERDQHGRPERPPPEDPARRADEERDVREQVQRGAAAERDRGTVSSSSSTWCSVVFETEGEEHDAGDHRQMEVAVRVAREPRAFDAVACISRLRAKIAATSK